MFQRIIVPLDGSRPAERVIPLAASLARAARGSIVLLQVVPQQGQAYGAEPTATIGIVPGLLEIALTKARQYLSSVTMAFRDYLGGIKIETEVQTGHPATTIAAAARREHGDVIVLYRHGKTGYKHRIFKPTTLQTALHSTVPVLILNEQGEVRSLEEPGHPLQVLVPLDGSTLAEAALAPTIQLLTTLTAAPASATLHLLRIVDGSALSGSKKRARRDPQRREHLCREAQSNLDTLVQRLQAAIQGTTSLLITTSVVISADIPATIARQAANMQCDLIAMATHGSIGLVRLLRGSVTAQVADATALPVLVVRPPRSVMHPKDAHDLGNDETVLPSWMAPLSLLREQNR